VVYKAQPLVGLFYRVLGLMALVHHVCRSIQVYHIIRVDWIAAALLVFYVFAGASALGLPWPMFPLEVPLAYPVLQTILASSALALFLTCWVRRDTVFRPMNVIPRGDTVPQATVPERPEPIDLRISGRFIRDFGRALSLRGLPVRWKIDDTGSILLESFIEDVHIGSEFPIPREDASGYWSLIIPRQVLIDGAEEGILHFGISARPAFRLRLPGRQITAILSVKNTSQMTALGRLFGDILAASTAQEADFSRTKLEGTLSKPLSPRPPAPAKGEATPGEEISWKDLIDFSR
jgi:hypothetical protein